MTLPFFDFAVRRLDKAVLIDVGEDAQGADQTDVGAFRRFDRAHSAVVRNVNVTHFKASPLAVQAAGAEGRKTTLVHQHGERVGLVNHLGQLGATKEEVDAHPKWPWSSPSR